MLNEQDESLRRVDPDPWVVANLVITTVGVLAQLSSIAIQVSDRKPQRWASLRDLQTRHLQSSIDESLRVAERISAFLARKGTQPDALERSYRSGEVTLFLSPADFQEYQEFVMRLTMNLNTVSHNTLVLINQNEEFAKQIGTEIIEAMGSLSARVNEMYTTQRTFGYVFEDCLFILRTLSEILGRLRGAEN